MSDEIFISVQASSYHQALYSVCSLNQLSYGTAYVSPPYRIIELYILYHISLFFCCQQSALYSQFIPNYDIWTSSFLIANKAACVLSATSIFLKILETWFFTVRSVILRLAPISLLDIPLEIWISTSNSRFVKLWKLCKLLFSLNSFNPFPPFKLFISFTLYPIPFKSL